MRPTHVISAVLVAAALAMSAVAAGSAESALRLAAGLAADRQPEAAGKDAADQGGEEKLTPEQKMQRRFPHPVRVGDLIGLPVLDDDDSTIGYVRQVVRSPIGKISLIVPYSSWLGWARTGWGKRPVAVPIEAVVILARQLDSLEMSRDDFDDAPTWMASQGKPIPPDEKTLIGLGRR